MAAGAAAAFLSTSSGLVVSLAGVLFTDVLRGAAARLPAGRGARHRLPLALALTSTRLDFALTVPLVFAVAASTFCPLLVLGIWWRGLTARGAVAGVASAGCSRAGRRWRACTCRCPHLDRGAREPAGHRDGADRVPRDGGGETVTRSGVPADVDAVLLQMHAPERLGLAATGSRSRATTAAT